MKAESLIVKQNLTSRCHITHYTQKKVASFVTCKHTYTYMHDWLAARVCFIQQVATTPFITLYFYQTVILYQLKSQWFSPFKYHNLEHTFMMKRRMYNFLIATLLINNWIFAAAQPFSPLYHSAALQQGNQLHCYTLI